LNYAPLFLAAEKGYYREQASTCSSIRWPAVRHADPDRQRPVRHRRRGVGSALFNAIQRGVPVRVVAPLHSEAKPDVDAAGGPQGIGGRRYD